MVVREASNATLICKAAGYPEPYVMWRREDGDDINYNGDTGRWRLCDDSDIMTTEVCSIIHIQIYYNIVVGE